jgi:hypothetical protein
MVSMKRKITILRFVSIVIIPFFSLIGFFLWGLVIANVDVITPDNNIYFPDGETPLLIQINNDFSDDFVEIRPSIINKTSNSFMVIYKQNDEVICSALISISDEIGTIEYEGFSYPSIGKVYHQNVDSVTFNFELSNCEFNEVGIYVENSHELKDLTPGLIVLSLIFILVFVINLYARQRFIQTVDVEEFRNTRISTRQKIGFIAIGIVSPVIAALLFMVIGTDTKNLKNIKCGELAIITSVIFLSVLFPVLLILITYI